MKKKYYKARILYVYNLSEFYNSLIKYFFLQRNLTTDQKLIMIKICFLLSCHYLSIVMLFLRSLTVPKGT